MGVGSGTHPCLASSAFLFIFTQHLMIALAITSHDTEQIMHTAAHIPLKERAATLEIDIEVLLVALDNQLILTITVKVGELVALPVFLAELGLISSVFSFDQVMIDGRTHVPHVDATEQSMPVGIVSLCFPEMYRPCLRCRTCLVDSIMHPQHFFMLIVDLRVAHQEIAPEAPTHKLKNIVAFFIFQAVQQFAKGIRLLWR